MEEELNLWEYLAAIVRRWPLVVAGVVLALLAAILLWALQPAHYRATTSLLVTAPRYEWRFDSDILPIVDTRRDWQGEVMALVKTRDVLAGALAQVPLPPGQEVEPSELAAQVETKAGPAGMFYLTVTWTDPERARQLANALAKEVVARARLLYGGDEELTLFEASMKAAEARLGEAEAALQAFQGQTGQELLRKGFEGLVGYSTDERELDFLSDQLAAHRTALANLDLLIEESRRILAEGGSPAAFPWQLAQTPVLAARELVTRTLPLRDPQAILRLLEEEREAVGAVTQKLEEQVLARQNLQAARATEYNRLVRERDLAAEAYSTLARKVEELRARQIAEAGNVQVVQEAAQAQKVRMSLSVALGLGVVVGLLVGVVGALVAERLAAPGGGATPHAA
jgi:uncharacterized protein involved in exopolysaccharide biosynthesis